MKTKICLLMVMLLLFSVSSIWAIPGSTSENKITIDSERTSSQKYVAYNQRAVIYDQTGNPSAEGFIASQDFETAYDVYDCQGADDFTVPTGETWVFDLVTVLGTLSAGIPHDLANVYIYWDLDCFPEVALYSYMGVHALDDGAGNLEIPIPSTSLAEGTYWISVQSASPFATYGQWYWGKQAAPTIACEAMWQNPGGGFAGCLTWCPFSTQWPPPDYWDYNLSFMLSLMPTNDVGVIDVTSPVSGVLTSTETVTIEIKNFGSATQTSIPVEYTFGGNTFTGTYTGSLPSFTTDTYSFTQTIDCSTPGFYSVEACTDLTGDEDVSNDCTTHDFECFATDCTWEIWLYDVYGDGWNGCTLDVLADVSIVLNDVTMVDGAGPEVFAFGIYDGGTVSTVFTAASYPEECWYEIYDNIGNLIITSGPLAGGPPDVLIDPAVCAIAPPTNVLITHDGTDVVLTWDAVTGATDYKVYRSTDPYTGFTELVGTTGGLTTYTDSGAAGTKYFYQVTGFSL